MSQDSPTVGFIGAGQMGMPMVARLHAAGVPVTVFARRPEVRDELAERGIAVAADAAELASGVDIVEICLFSDEQQQALLFDGGVASAMRPGSILMSHVTGSPALYDLLVEAVAPGVGVVDAPVSGTAEQIAVGQLTVLLGGTDHDVQRVSPVLSSFASRIIHAGPLGDGQRVKLVNNLLFTVHLRLAGEAVRLGTEFGIDQQRLVNAVMQCSASSLALGLLADRPFSDFGDSIQRFLRKDVAVVDAVAAELGVDIGLLGDLAHGAIEIG